MELLKSIIDTMNGWVWNTPDVLPFLVVMLLGTGLFLTLRMGFVQLRRFGHSLRVILGHYDDPNDPGEVSHFQALSAALSATVGIGNIAGVAIAIHYGGPGALFWMWISAFVGMASKYTECTLAVRYRKIRPDGEVSGGPMHYIEQGLGRRWLPVAIFFAVCAVISSFGSGNAVQAFTMADQFRSSLGVPTWISGLVAASLVGLVVLGGIRRIASVASRVVPFMATLYVAAALIVLIGNASEIPAALALIVKSAFTAAGAVGGFAGSTFIFTLTWGIKRGLFSNEAGQGSAPIAHAAAQTDEPVREGAVALLEPFIDTLVICTMTGLVIVTTGVWKDKIHDVLPLDAQSSVRWVSGETEILPTAIFAKTEESFDATFVEGVPTGARAVRNHSFVEKAHVSLEGAPFNGRLVVTPEETKVFDAQGATISMDRLELAGDMLQNGSPLTGWAFERGLSHLFPGGRFLVTFSVFLFAISTAISWSYYGDRAIQYLLGDRAVLPYRIVFTCMHFVGAIFSLEIVWGFGDLALGLMSIPNLIAIVLLSGKVKKMQGDYFGRMKG